MSLELSKEGQQEQKTLAEILDAPLDKGWEGPLAEALEAESYKNLSTFLAEQYAKYKDEIRPEYKNLFKAFELTPYDKVKVVILGQDPYPGKGHADGLSFSASNVKPPTPFPDSLKIIFEELEGYLENKDDFNKDLVKERLSHGDLTAWAEQGVLLLNTALSFRRRGERGNWHKMKWKFFTNAVIKAVNKKEKPVVFVLWGRDAQKKRTLITNDIHHVLIAPHPVFNGTCETRDEDKKQPNYDVSSKFSGSEPFKKINEFLAKEYPNELKPVIDWQLK